MRGLLGLEAKVRGVDVVVVEVVLMEASEMNFPGNVTNSSSSSSLSLLFPFYCTTSHLSFLVLSPHPLSQRVTSPSFQSSFLPIACLPSSAPNTNEHPNGLPQSQRKTREYVSINARSTDAFLFGQGSLRVVRRLSEMAPTWGCWASTARSSRSGQRGP